MNVESKQIAEAKVYSFEELHFRHELIYHLSIFEAVLQLQIHFQMTID